MNQKETSGTTLTIKGNLISPEMQFQKKTKLTSQFKGLFSEFLDSFKDMNSILNTYSQKNLLLIEDINKSFSSFVREAENIDTENTVNYVNITRQLKKLSNLFSKLLTPDIKSKTSMIKIDNFCIELYATTRFLQDVVNLEKKSTKDENMVTSPVKEYQRIANEFANRFPRYQGFKIDIKTYKEEFDIQINTSNQVSTPRLIRNTMQTINDYLVEFLEYELEKIGQKIICYISVSNGLITVEYESEGDEEDEEEEEDY